MTSAIVAAIILVLFLVAAIIARTLLHQHVTTVTPVKSSRRVLAIYLCSPFRGDDMLMNIDFARRFAREVQLAGGRCVTLFASHLHTPQYLNDAVELERDLGISAGCAIMARFDEAWFRLPPWRTAFSTGMKGELETAQDLGLRIRIFHTDADYERALRELSAMSDRDAKVSA